ncbi:MAG: transcription elongation factor GreA [Clostridia bacterium]|nr:transcription elongation factor GreA [Clostridia bacterium]
MEMAKQVKLTPEGLEKLKEELEDLKVNGRKEIAAKIQEARGFGDLSENSEYDAAKDAQAAMEQRIIELDNIINNAIVVTGDEAPADVVSIMSKVVVHDCDLDEDEEFIIVGSTESDPMSGKISDESPIGMALLGRKLGETIDIETPGGIIQYKILDIQK